MNDTMTTKSQVVTVGCSWLVIIAALYGTVAVGIGAIGAHSLPKQLAARSLPTEEIAKKLSQCELAVRYQMYHAIAALVLGAIPSTGATIRFRVAGSLLLLGALLFSGGLYLIVFFDNIVHWAIVPAGGMTMIVGWLCVAIAAIKR